MTNYEEVVQFIAEEVGDSIGIGDDIEDALDIYLESLKDSVLKYIEDLKG